MRHLLLSCLLLSTQALGGPDQRTTVGDGGLADLLGVIASEQPAQATSCRTASLSQVLDAQAHALDSSDGMGCKAIAGRLEILDDLSQRAGACHDDDLQRQASNLGAQYRAIASRRCQASQDGAGEIAGLAELGLAQLQQRAEAKAARQQAQLEQQRLAEQARQAALVQQRAMAARAVTTTSENPYASDAGKGDSSAASGESEICPLSEPYKSQCDARNAARQNGKPTPAARSGSGFIYDDYNYNQCVRLQTLPYASPSGYGSYYMHNTCNVDIIVHWCSGQDRADGTPDDSLDLVRNQRRCPKGGMGATEIKAGGRYQGRTWWAYKQLEIGYYACKTGWSLVNAQTDTSIRNLNEKYRCRKLR